MTSERSYRIAVIPLSIFLVLGGITFAALAWVAHVPMSSPFPFIESESLDRRLFGVAGVVCAIIGVGLFRRNGVAWYALLVYLGLGVLLPAVSVLDAETVAVQGYAFPIAGSVLNGCIAVGIYFAMRPAFLQAARESDPSVEVPSVRSGAE